MSSKRFPWRPVAILVLLQLTTTGHASPWQGSIEVLRNGGDGNTISGHVFEDLNRDSQRQDAEPGIPGVLVSNGLDVTTTDADGRYELPVHDDMDLFVIQPQGWRVPVDARMIPQFAYTHKPGGSPFSMRFGGLADTGPAPSAVNFPLQRAAAGSDFRCAIIGDSQTYSHHELSQYRDSAITDLVSANMGGNDCMLYVGDVMGDDLGLMNRLAQVGAVVGAPQWLVPGNHDLDFDADRKEDAFDTWRREYGPAYYAFEIGEVTFIALDNIFYPCGERDMQLPNRDFCGDPARKVYNIRVSDQQLEWMENLLAHIPEERLVVLAHHGPLVSFYSASSSQHQDDATPHIHALLEGRPALSLAGHIHVTEVLAPGEHYAGWMESVGVGPLPFRHIVAGAASGNWWQGDFMYDGDAHALQRMGAPKGVMMLSFTGTDYSERYVGSRIDPARGQWVDFNTPDFRHWFDTIMDWRDTPRDERDPVPPLSVNDLPDTRILTFDALAEGVWATANVWAGSMETRVVGQLSDGRELVFERTQEGQGEAVRIGAEWADPFTAKRQLTVGRFAIESRSGIERNQGYEAYRGSEFRGPPQPQTAVTDRNMHLWRARMPQDLSEGVHVLTITSIDRNDQRYVDHLIFEVREEQPPMRFRRELFE